MSKKQKSKQKTATASQPKQLTLDDVLAHIVDVRPSLGHKIIQFLLDNPSKNIVEIAARLGNHKDGMFTPAMYALEGITMTALEPVNEKIRHTVALAYIKALRNPRLSDDAIAVIINHLRRLGEPAAATALIDALPLGNPIAKQAIQAIREISEKNIVSTIKPNALLKKIKPLSPEIKDELILALLEHGNIECTRDALEGICEKKPSDLTSTDLPIIMVAAKYGMKVVQPLLMKMLEGTNKYLKAYAILAITGIINFYIDLAEKEGGFDNYANSLDEEEDCDCQEDSDCNDNCDCLEDDCDEDECQDDWEEYNCEDDYDFHACLIAKQFFFALPCVASLDALLKAYGETKDTAAIIAGALANPDPRMRDFALAQLKFAFTAPDFDEFLYTLAIESNNPAEKCGLIEVLGMRNVTQARPYLTSLLQHSEPQIAKAAYNALSSMPSSNVWIQDTLEALKHEQKRKNKRANNT